jgi:hypothetical protein
MKLVEFDSFHSYSTTARRERSERNRERSGGAPESGGESILYLWVSQNSGSFNCKVSMNNQLLILLLLYL